MDGSMTTAIQPAHVPDHLVFDFDIYADQRLTNDIQRSYAEVLSSAPEIFWTPKNGGHWIVKSFDAISEVVRDPEHFSVREMQIPRVENPPFFIPLSLDPPENLPYRQAMVPMFGPVAVKALEPRIREWAAKIIDSVVAKGSCDFQGEVAKLFPVTVFMELMGMDLARLPEFRKLAEDFFEYQNNAEELGRLSGEIMGILGALIAEKRANPDGKLMSHFIQVDVGNRVMADEEIMAMSFVLFLGGMDTVTNLTGFAYQQLAQLPDLQKRMASDPNAIASFVDEAVRLYGVVNTPRLVAKDRTIGEAHFKEGEMVLNILTVGSRDPSKFEDPDTLNIDRKKAAHLTFSSGPHLCIGHFLGRTELRILTEEWFKRIPSFELVPDVVRHYRAGTVMALENLPIRWPAQ